VSVQDDAPEVPVRIVSMFGHRTQQPIVNVTIGDTMHQWRPEEAKRIGNMLIEVAFAAEADGFLHDWVMEATGAGQEGAAKLMVEFRKWRAARGETETR
jgi:hypothetical protein